MYVLTIMPCSFLDILYLGRIFPKRAAIMAKRELQWSPLLGQYRESERPLAQNAVLRRSADAPLPSYSLGRGHGRPEEPQERCRGAREGWR
jgi:hypothetical protein